MTGIGTIRSAIRRVRDRPLCAAASRLSLRVVNLRGALRRPGGSHFGSFLGVGLLSLLAAGMPARAQVSNPQAGTSGAQFLKIGAGSRAGAMAEAYAALADDVYGMYYNPAALTSLHEAQVGGAHTSYFQGSNYEVLDFAYPLASGRTPEYSKHVLGFGLYNLSVSGIERRTADTSGNLGTFGAGDYAYGMTYGYRVDPTLGLGATAKVVSQTIDTYNSTAFATDLGAQYTPFPEARRPVSFAAVLTNFGTRPSFAGISDPLPLGATLGAGLCIIPKQLQLEVDAVKYRDTNAFFNVGGEFSHAFSDGLSAAFRAGYSSHHKDISGLNGVTLGMGVSFYRASFDFAWVPFGDLGDTFRYSLLIRFGGLPSGEKFK